MPKRSGNRMKKLLHGEALENAVKEALENREPWASICHRLHVGTRLIQKVREKHFPSEVVENDTENHSNFQGTDNDVQVEEERDYAESGNSTLDVSKVLKLFEQEKGPVEVAIELKLHSKEDFREVQRLYEEWKKVKERDLPSETVSGQLKDLSERVTNLQSAKKIGSFAASTILFSVSHNAVSGNQKINLLHLACPFCFSDLIPFGEGMDSGYKCSNLECEFSLTWQDIEEASAP
jgi:hypothetical protein